MIRSLPFHAPPRPGGRRARTWAARALVAAALGVGGVVGAAGQEPPAVPPAAVPPAERRPAAPAGAIPLDLDGAVTRALEQSFAILNGRNAVAGSREQVAASAAAFGPTLSVSAGPELRWAPTTDAAGRTHHTRSTADGATASAHLNLWNGFADVANLLGAQLTLAASEKDLQNIRQTLAFQAATAFLEVHLDRDLAAADERNLEAERSQLTLIQAFFDAGNRSQADVLQEKAAVAAAEQRLLASRQKAEVALLNLKQLLRYPPEAELALAAPPADLLAGRDPAGGLAGERQAGVLERLALADRPDVVAQRLRIGAAEQAIRAARAGFYPTLTLDGSLGTSYTDRARGGILDQIRDNPQAAVGLSLNVPVLDRRRAQTAVAQAEIARDREQLALAELEEQVRFEVRQSLLDLATGDLQIAAAEAQVASAQEALNATEARYQVGLATFVEVALSRSALIQAQAARLQALYGRADSLLLLAQRAGNLWGAAGQAAPPPETR